MGAVQDIFAVHHEAFDSCGKCSKQLSLLLGSHVGLSPTLADRDRLDGERFDGRHQFLERLSLVVSDVSVDLLRKDVPAITMVLQSILFGSEKTHKSACQGRNEV